MNQVNNSEGSTRERLKKTAIALRNYVLENRRSLVLTGGVWAVCCWFINVVLMVRFYDGWRKVPVGGLATGSENVWMGFVFWGLLSSLIFSVIRRRTRAKEIVGEGTAERKVLQDSRRAERVNIGPRRGATLLLGVVAGAILFRLFGAVIPLYAVILLTSRLSAISYWTTLLTLRGWRRFAGLLASQFPEFSGRFAVELIYQLQWLTISSKGLLLGSTVNLVLDFLAPPDFNGEILTVSNVLLGTVVTLCIWRAVMRRKRTSRTNLPSCLLMIGGAIVAEHLLSVIVMADDGGWQESGSSIQGLLDNPGLAPTVSSGAFGGLAGGMGAVAGLAAENLSGEQMDLVGAMKQETERLLLNERYSMRASGAAIHPSDLDISAVDSEESSAQRRLTLSGTQESCGSARINKYDSELRAATPQEVEWINQYPPRISIQDRMLLDEIDKELENSGADRFSNLSEAGNDVAGPIADVSSALGKAAPIPNDPKGALERLESSDRPRYLHKWKQEILSRYYEDRSSKVVENLVPPEVSERYTVHSSEPIPSHVDSPVPKVVSQQVQQELKESYQLKESDVRPAADNYTVKVSDSTVHRLDTRK